MLNNFIKLSQQLVSKSFKTTRTMNKIIQHYTLLHVSNFLDINQDQQIFKNMEESRAIIINQPDIHQENQYLFIGFKNTIIIIKSISLSFLQNLFSINKKLKICFLSNTEYIFNQNIKIEYQLLSTNGAFQEEMFSFNNYLSLPASIRPQIHQIWNIIRPCITGFLIKQSYEKLTKNRFRDFYSNNSTPDKLNEDDYITLRVIGFGTIFKVELL